MVDEEAVRASFMLAAQTHRQLANYPLLIDGRRWWIETAGEDANTFGPRIRDGGFLCRSQRDLTTSVQTGDVISDCLQQRTLGVSMTLEQGVSSHRLLRYAEGSPETEATICSLP